jgi:hypothetical protein
MVDDTAAALSSPRAKPALDGASSAAILLMLLDESDAATILKHLDPEEVRHLAKAMFDTANASERQIEQALEQFVMSSRGVSALAVGADTRIRTVIHEAVGNVRADNILAAAAPQRSAASLEMLRWMDVEAIRALLDNEHPQVGALILSVLVPDVAADGRPRRRDRGSGIGAGQRQRRRPARRQAGDRRSQRCRQDHEDDAQAAFRTDDPRAQAAGQGLGPDDRGRDVRL